MANFERILITGAAGTLAPYLREGLRPLARRMRLTDCNPVEPLHETEECVVCDLADGAAVAALARDVDAVIHLGVRGSRNAFDPMARANLYGAYNIFEACRLNGVKRLVLASANHVTGFHRMRETIDASAPAKPDSIYGATKLFAEGLAQYYFDRFDLESVSLRIGTCVPKPRNRRELSTWLSPDDFVHLVERSLLAPRVRHTVVYGVSDNTAKFWDNRLAEHIGFRPRHNAEIYRTEIEARFPNPDLSDWLYIYQGGKETKEKPFGAD